jgi:citrate lyase beta subunit
MNSINFSLLEGLKGEFEAEGLTRDEVSAESLYAARHGLDYLVKIGGCEAKSDVQFLLGIGIQSVVAPMIETPFAMQKYMEMLPLDSFKHVSVTIETITAVQNIEEIITAGTRLTEVTIGRTDLSASYGSSDVDSARTTEMVKQVASCAKGRGLKVTMGGSINKKTQILLASDPELLGLLDYIETRKVVMSIDQFMDSNSLKNALEIEAMLLEMRAVKAEGILNAINQRRAAIKSRI